MDDKGKAALVRLSRYARTASGGIDTSFAAAPSPMKSIMPAAKPTGLGFLDKVKAVGGQTLRIAAQGAAAGGKFVFNTGKDIGSAAVGTARTIRDIQTQPAMQAQMKQIEADLDRKQDAIIKQYKSGKMSKQDYTKALEGMSKAYQDLSKMGKPIIDGPTPQQRAMDVAETAVNALSLGTVQLTGQATKAAVQAGVRSGSKYLLDDAAVGIEKQFLKSKAFRSLIERNIDAVAKRAASETTEQLVKREAKHIAASLLIKRPVFYQSNIGQAQSLYNNILEGDYKGAATDAAWLGSQMINGGPLGAAYTVFGKAKVGLGTLAKGKGSMIDEISARIGNGDRRQIAQFIADSGDKDVEKVFRVLQDSNMRITGGKADLAAENLLRSFAHLKPEEITPEYIAQHAKTYLEADTIKKSAVKQLLATNRISPEDAEKLVVVNVDRNTRNAIARAVVEAGSPEEALAAVKTLAEQPNTGFGANSNFMLRIEQSIKQAATLEDAASAIQQIDAAKTISGLIPKDKARLIAKLGYTVSEIPGRPQQEFADNIEDTARLVSSAMKGGTDLFEEGKMAQPQIAAIARFLERSGVSPEESSTLANRKMGEYIADRLQQTVAGKTLGLNKQGDKARGGQAILSKLQQYIENKAPARVPGAGAISAGKSAVVDIRQLTVSEIQEALQTTTKGGRLEKLGRDEAKEIAKAIVKGYQDIPLEFRGLGDRVVDTLYAINPAQKYYSRIQSALRYTYNPFFRVQENVETKLLSRAQASNMLWNRNRAQLDEAVRILDDNRVFSGVLPGEAANEQVIGRITANLTRGQKRDLAGLAYDIADAKGLPLEQLVKDFPEEIDDALRVVVQYPRQGGLASPLARTLNLVFFPMRYNLKVTKLAADVLAKQPASVQKAVIHSGFKMREWLKSDEGIQWQSQNADALQLFQWLTPVNSIQYTMNLLRGPDSLAEFGQLGGLPLGFITQILDGQGVIDMNKPYVQPKTGDVIPEDIPVTTRARAAVALGDLINTMFTYPGRTMGLPGKEAQIKKLVDKFIDTNGADFEKRLDLEKLTPLQQNWIRVLKGDNSADAIDALYNSPAGNFNWYTLPVLDFPELDNAQPAQPTRASKVKAGRGTKPKKIAQPMQLN